MIFELADELEWLDVKEGEWEQWLAKLLSLKDHQHYKFRIQSWAFGVEKAFELVEQLKKRGITYDLVITHDVGSVATVLACGAETVYMSKRASLSPLDPTIPIHGYPQTFISSQFFRLNPAELEPLLCVITQVWDSEDRHEVMEHLLRRGINCSVAQQQLDYTMRRLEELLNGKCDCPHDVAHYLTIGAGSWDARIFKTDMKNLGLKIQDL